MALPTWLNGASLSQWLSITSNASTNNLDDVTPNPTDSPSYPGSDNALSIVEAWNDGALRVSGTTFELLCHGGGHGDGSDNAIYKFGNINSDSPAWSRVSGSYSNPTDVVADASHYADSPSKPSAMHGYKLLAYDPGDDVLVRMGCAVAYGGSANSYATVDSFSFGSATWAKKTSSSLIRDPAQGAAVFNTSDNKIYYFYGGGGFPYDGLTSYDHGTDTHADAASGNTGSELAAGSSMAYDSSRNHILMLDTTGNKFMLWDNLNSSPLQIPRTITLSGDTEIESLTLGGLVYDAERDLYVFYRGSSGSPDQQKAIYEIDPSPYDASPNGLTWTSTRVNPGGGVTPTAPTSPGESIQGRFIYIQADSFSGYLLFRQHDSDVYFYPTRIVQTVTPSGVSASGSVGTLSAVSQVTLSLSGVQSLVSAGTLSTTQGSTIALSGVVVTGDIGILTANTQTVAMLNAVSATGGVGTFAITTGAAVPIDGVSTTGQIGTITVSLGGGETVVLVGVSALGQVGDLTAVEAQLLTLQGVSLSAVVGILDITTHAAFSLDGVSSTGSAGTITADVSNISIDIPDHQKYYIETENRRLLIITE